MKILSFIPESGYSIPYIAQDSISALRELGQSVEVVDLREEKRLSFLRYKIRRFKPDFIFTIDHIGLKSQLFAQLKVPYISWSTVNPFFWLRPEDISPYLHLFVWDRSYIKELKEVGCKNLHHLPLATNPKVFRRLSLTQQEIEKYGCNISFAGGWREERANLFLEVADFGVSIYGYGDEWHSIKHPKIKYYGLIDNRKELPKLYNATKINLNTTHPTLRTTIPVRIYDICACGAFVLSDFREDLIRFFEEGKEIVYYRNKDEFKEMVNFYLAHPKEREEIARMAQQRVLKQHTFIHRMKELLNIVKDWI